MRVDPDCQTLTLDLGKKPRLPTHGVSASVVRPGQPPLDSHLSSTSRWYRTTRPRFTKGTYRAEVQFLSVPMAMPRYAAASSAFNQGDACR